MPGRHSRLWSRGHSFGESKVASNPRCSHAMAGYSRNGAAFVAQCIRPIYSVPTGHLAHRALGIWTILCCVNNWIGATGSSGTQPWWEMGILDNWLQGLVQSQQKTNACQCSIWLSHELRGQNRHHGAVAQRQSHYKFLFVAHWATCQGTGWSYGSIAKVFGRSTCHEWALRYFVSGWCVLIWHGMPSGHIQRIFVLTALCAVGSGTVSFGKALGLSTIPQTTQFSWDHDYNQQWLSKSPDSIQSSCLWLPSRRRCSRTCFKVEQKSKHKTNNAKNAWAIFNRSSWSFCACRSIAVGRKKGKTRMENQSILPIWHVISCACAVMNMFYNFLVCNICMNMHPTTFNMCYVQFITKPLKLELWNTWFFLKYLVFS